MKTQIVNYYDDETNECIGQKFIIDGEEVTLEDFADFTGDAIEIIGECSETMCDEDCENCEYYDEDIDDEESISEIIDDYVEIIQNTEGCENCIRKALENFFDEICDMFEEE